MSGTCASRSLRVNGGVLQAPDAVVDSLRPQHVQGLPDVLGWPLFPGVGHPVKPVPRRLLEHGLEGVRRVAGFGRVEAHAHEPLLEREGLA